MGERSLVTILKDTFVEFKFYRNPPMNKSLFDLKKELMPKDFSQALTDMGEVYFWPKGNFWVVTDYEAAKFVLRSDAFTCDRKPFFLSRMPEMDLSLLPDFFNVVSRMMVMNDDTIHKNGRRVCYHGFTNKHIHALKPNILHTINQSLEQIDCNQPFDFVEKFAELIPKTTLADFFAIPHEDRDEFSQYAKQMTSFFGGESDYKNEDGIKVNHAAKSLFDYFTELSKDRKRFPKEDFFSELLKYQSHFGLSDADIIAQAIMMWVAGMVTTNDQISNNCFSLVNAGLDHFNQAVKSDALESLVEELNRLDPAVTFTFRMTRKAVTLNKQTIPEGATVFISNHAVNRDKKIWVDPDSICLNRTQKHFSYGFGGHYCLGAKLSLIEMGLCFDALFKRFSRVTMVDYKRHHYSLSFSGFEYLILDGK